MTTRAVTPATPSPMSSSVASSASNAGPTFGGAAVQRRAALRGKDYATQMKELAPGGGPQTSGEDVHAAAAHGTSGAGAPLPHLDRIQSAFGRHDVSNVQAHVGGAARDASAAMGAQAYASGQDVAFSDAPTLHTAAHEAAHVVQQQAGVSLAGGVGQSGDAYEQHADRAADAVVAGESAEPILSEMASAGGGSGGATQRRAVQREEAPATDAAAATETTASTEVSATEVPTEVATDGGGTDAVTATADLGTPATEATPEATATAAPEAAATTPEAAATTPEAAATTPEAAATTPEATTTTPEAAATPTPEAAPAAAPNPAAEREVARSAYLGGNKSVDSLTNLVFYGRHAERVHGADCAPIAAGESDLVAEWTDIRKSIVQPVLAEEAAKAAPAASATPDAAAGTSAGTTASEPAAADVAAEPAPAATPDEARAIIAPFATYLPFTETIASLDEAGLGAELARAHALSAPDRTRLVFDTLSSEDRDDVAFALVSALTDAQVGSLDGGLKAYLAEQLVGGYSGADEAAQAARLTGGAASEATAGETSTTTDPTATTEQAATAGATDQAATPEVAAATPAATPAVGATTEGGAKLGGQSSAEVRVGTVMTVLDPQALRRDPTNLRATLAGQLLPQGLKVIVVKGLGTYVQVISAPGEATTLTEADNAWTSGGNLGGSGADVGLGNERTNTDAAAKAEATKSNLPTGRNPGQSPYSWRFGSSFAVSLDGITLSATLLQKLTRMLEWAVQNDMLAGNVEVGSGMRSPADAHRLCVSWEIQFGKRVTLDALKALPGGKDSDGNFWYQEGWTWDEVKTNANKNAARTAKATASEGYAKSDPQRLPVDTTRDVSKHTWGGAIDVTIPWRAKGQDASTNAADVWGWEEINAQFGLYRAVSSECWHLQETGTALEQDRQPETGPGG